MENKRVQNLTLFTHQAKIIVSKRLEYVRHTRWSPYHWTERTGQITILGHELICPIETKTNDDVYVELDLSASNRLLIALESFMQKRLSTAVLTDDPYGRAHICLETRKNANDAFLRIYRQDNGKFTADITLNRQEVLVLERTVSSVLRTLAN